MGDWKQIQGRIRRAKAGADPLGRLAALYEKTHDAMVAFELAQLNEKSGQIVEAARWYNAAVERFRRAEWKTKAEEALARLGASKSTPISSTPARDEHIPPSPFGTSVGTKPSVDSSESAAEKIETRPEPGAAQTGGAEAEPAPPRGKRRRGRRGGRGRRRGARVQARSRPESSGVKPTLPHIVSEPPAQVGRGDERPSGAGRYEEAARITPEPTRPEEPAVGPAAWQIRGRTGEPALASRMAQLESQLRRLLASPLHRLDEADQAPAGPGVFILSDSDLTTYYDIEACQTLRVGIANLLRGERGSKHGRDSLRARFAEHLGISESRVTKYLKDHCAVRWLQLDEGAPPLAHFAIAVLRPVLND